MTDRNVTCGSIEAAELVIDPQEIARRMRIPQGEDIPAAEDCLKELLGVCRCRYASVRTPVKVREDCVDLGFTSVKSKQLAKVLEGCNEAFVFGVTLGSGVDTLLRRLSVMSPLEHFITDALASALAEALTDEVDGRLSAELRCAKRYSPGYGDLPLEIQKEVLGALESVKTLGITLTDSLLMTPTKSVTAILGIYDE